MWIIIFLTLSSPMGENTTSMVERPHDEEKSYWFMKQRRCEEAAILINYKAPSFKAIAVCKEID